MNIDALLEKLAYLPQDEIDFVVKSYHYSEKAHAGQKRDSGRPFIIHPLTVADILADWRLDSKAIAAALLHDVVEDTPITSAQIRRAFGGEVAGLVDGISKIDHIQKLERSVREAENFRNLFVSAISDWRVFFIKLADRLHNMRTISGIAEPDRRRRIINETMEIFAPLAERLGLRRVQEELQILSFKHLKPHRFRILSKALKHARADDNSTLTRTEAQLREALDAAGFAYQLEKRKKNLYSIHRKMVEDRIRFSEIEDILGFRIIVDSRDACYRTLGIVHGLFVPIRERFKDYIAIPKANGYQSLHTRGITKTGAKVDVQIRSRTMHRIAESGIASHWIYKQYGDTDAAEVQQHAMQHFSSLLSLYDKSESSRDFLEYTKVELIAKEMYILTPTGEVLQLPREATGLDVAYAIHTEVGNHAASIIVNARHRPLFTALENGDQVRVLTHPGIHPRPQWLRHAKTARARSHIRNYLNKQSKEDLIATGRQLLATALQSIDETLTPDDITEDGWQHFFKTHDFKDRNTLYQRFALGQIIPEIAARTLLRRQLKKHAQKLKPLLIEGAGVTAITLSECCCPLPYEPIVGLLRKEHGLIIHSTQCETLGVMSQKSEKWLEVAWSPTSHEQLHNGRLLLQCKNATGLATTVAGHISNANVNIAQLNFSGGESRAATLVLNVVVEVHDINELETLMQGLAKLPQVLDCRRDLRPS